MEQVDRLAYRVLKNNYVVLCTDLDARRVTTEACRRGLINVDEKKSIWHRVVKDSPSAGAERFLDLLVQSSRKGVFEQLVEILAMHDDLKFWADCLRGKLGCSLNGGRTEPVVDHADAKRLWFLVGLLP